MSFYSTDPLTAGRMPAEKHGKDATNMVAYMKILTDEALAGTHRWVRCHDDADGAIRLIFGEDGSAMLETDCYVRMVPVRGHATVPASSAGIHGVFTKHLLYLEAAGETFAKAWRSVGMSLEECRDFLVRCGYSAATVNNMSAGRTKFPSEILDLMADLQAIVDGDLPPGEDTPAGVVERRDVSRDLRALRHNNLKPVGRMRKPF